MIYACYNSIDYFYSYLMYDLISSSVYCFVSESSELIDPSEIFSMNPIKPPGWLCIYAMSNPVDEDLILFFALIGGLIYYT